MDSLGQSSASSTTGSSNDDYVNETDWFPNELRDILTEEGNEPLNIGVLSLLDVRTSEIKKDLQESTEIGLSLVRDRQEPIFICFTTKENIYYFNARNEKEVKFVDRQLRRDELKFFSTDGPFNSRSLMANLRIRLNRNNLTDLVSLDLFLTVKENLANQNVRSSFSVGFLHDQIRPKHLSYEELVSKYFPHCRADRLDLGYSRTDLAHIRNDPNGQLAKNIIKKRAAPVRALAKMMLQEYNKSIEGPSKQIFSLAKVTDEQREDFDRQCISERGSVNYVHLSAFLKNC